MEVASIEKIFLQEIKELFSDEVWSNGACMGYAIIACEELDIDKADIVKIISQLNSVFDRISVEDAKRKYSNF